MCACIFCSNLTNSVHVGFQILTTALPYNYHQSLPRHFLREGSTLSNPERPNNQLQNVPLQHSNRVMMQQQQQHPRIVGLPVSTALPTVSATLYAQNRNNGGCYAGGGQINSSRYQPLRTPYYTTLGNGGRGGGGAGVGGGHSPRQQLVGQGQQQRHFDAYYYHPATLRPSNNNSNESSSSGHQTGTSQSSCSSSSVSSRPPLPSQRVLYADLALDGGVAIPSDQQQQQKRNTDYAILKFNANNQIGKEIDV